ncbi:LacI family DNA-binding transcriptional regulator [Phycicoccus sp. BSK3Z-2]|uniref:LacI family DNA-binding transcriptional regulator n=1 Tax=Phycicoccus avicenniae TaxID=2828860 RepID=A0A941DEP7_9MICO|nr:LacI family DNA-binding transcriptional regulator [Phycicoccus avicenniae]
MSSTGDRATMRDVATLAGVSLKTVSRVVNDERGVSPEVRQRVSAAVVTLGYRPNHAASTLRRRGARTGLVGALLQDLSNSFSGALLRAIEDVARENRTAVLTASIDEEVDRERDLVRDLLGRQVDGLVLMPTGRDHAYLGEELRAGPPVVFVDRPPRGLEADAVTVDNVLGARRGTEHLLAQGHRRVAGLFHLPGVLTAQDRVTGFTAAHADRGMQPDPRLVVTGVPSSVEAARVVGEMLALDDPPTAIFAGRNNLSTGAIRALAERGVQHRVALVGFDDYPLADLVDPPLTVVKQNVPRIGRAVGELLFARVAGDPSPPRHLVVEPTLVPRGSGEIPPPG